VFDSFYLSFVILSLPFLISVPVLFIYLFLPFFHPPIQNKTPLRNCLAIRLPCSILFLKLQSKFYNRDAQFLGAGWPEALNYVPWHLFLDHQ